MTYLWNAHDCVPLRVNCVLGVKFDGGVISARQSPPISQPLAARSGFSSKPDVIPLGYFYSSYIEINRNDGIDTKETSDNINRFITSNTII